MYSLEQAIFLSSKNQACAFLPDSKNNFCRGYKLIVTDTDNEKTTLDIHRVTYSDTKEGQGLGNPVVAEKPHRTVKRDTPNRMYGYLKDYGFPVDEGWFPMEENNGTESK